MALTFKCKPFPVRFQIMIMIFLSTYICYTTRTNISLSLSAMVEIVDKKGKVDPVCEQDVTEKKVKPKEKPRDFKWMQMKQSYVLSAYYYGYVPSSLPAGYIAERVGPFWTLFVSMGAAGILNSICVFVVGISGEAGFWLFFICRLLIGICGGLVYPALQCLIGRWAPPNERGKFVAAMMGNTLGTCFTWMLVGFVTREANWQWGFHVVSMQHIPYLILLWFLVYDSPEQHKRIKEEELKYIKEAQGGNVSKTKSTPPYKKILVSIPFLMLNILHFGNLYGLHIQLTSVPKFMVEYIGYNIKDSGIWGALPNLVRFFSGIGYGALGDYLKTHQFNREKVLKIGVIFSHVIPGILMGFMGLVECNLPAALALLVLSCSINGAAVITNLSNPTDLSPNYAGTLFGIMSFTGGTTGFIVPPILSGMIELNGNKKSTWLWFFAMGGIVYVAFGILFMIFGTSKTQPWNEKKEDQREEAGTAKT